MEDRSLTTTWFAASTALDGTHSECAAQFWDAAPIRARVAP
jgi:hypothetical protein